MKIKFHCVTQFNILFRGGGRIKSLMMIRRYLTCSYLFQYIVRGGWRIFIPREDILTCYDLFLGCCTKPILGSQVVLGTGCLPSDAIAVTQPALAPQPHSLQWPLCGLWAIVGPADIVSYGLGSADIVPYGLISPCVPDIIIIISIIVIVIIIILILILILIQHHLTS